MVCVDLPHPLLWSCPAAQHCREFPQDRAPWAPGPEPHRPGKGLSWTWQHFGVLSFLLAAGVSCAGAGRGAGMHSLLQRSSFHLSQDGDSFLGSLRALRDTPRSSYSTIPAPLLGVHSAHHCAQSSSLESACTTPPGTFILILLIQKQSDKFRMRNVLPHTSQDSSKSLH